MDKKNKLFNRLTKEAEEFNFYGDSSVEPKIFGGIGAIMTKENDDECTFRHLLTNEFLETLRQVEAMGDWDDKVETGKFVERCFELAGKPSPIKWGKIEGKN